MPVVIGIVGAKGSGKGTFASAIERFVPEHVSVIRVRMSDLLRETLERWHLSATRANLQNLSKIMDGEFGNGTLAHAVGHRIASSDAEIVVVDGVRWEADRLLVRSFTDSLLVAVTADVRVRYERLRARGENAKEIHASFVQFCEEEQAMSERAIPAISATADVTIVNEGSVEDFHRSIQHCYEEHIRKLLRVAQPMIV